MWVKGREMNSIDSQIPQMPEVRIARLEEELAEAHAEVERLKDLVGSLHEAIGEDSHSDDESLPVVITQMVKEMRERIAWQEAEVERLRAALKEMLDSVWFIGLHTDEDGCEGCRLRKLARAALRGGE
jgi:uncharacterized small protein (DUF1192 family)